MLRDTSVFRGYPQICSMTTAILLSISHLWGRAQRLVRYCNAHLEDLLDTSPIFIVNRTEHTCHVACSVAIGSI